MKRFLIATVAIWSTFVLVVGIIAGLGRVMPPSDHLRLWGLNTDCSTPCLLGITPGSTTLDNASRSINTTFAQHQYVVVPDNTDPTLPFASFTLATNRNQKDNIRVALVGNQGAIETVGVQANTTVSNEMPTLGEVVAAFGPPTCIIYYLDRSPTQSLVISYAAEGRSELLHIEVNHNNPTWLTPITTMVLYKPAESPTWCNTRADIYTPPWQGLISQGHYEAMNQQ